MGWQPEMLEALRALLSGFMFLVPRQYQILLCCIDFNVIIKTYYVVIDVTLSCVHVPLTHASM